MILAEKARELDNKSDSNNGIFVGFFKNEEGGREQIFMRVEFKTKYSHTFILKAVSGILSPRKKLIQKRALRPTYWSHFFLLLRFTPRIPRLYPLTRRLT